MLLCRLHWWQTAVRNCPPPPPASLVSPASSFFARSSNLPIPLIFFFSSLLQFSFVLYPRHPRLSHSCLFPHPLFLLCLSFPRSSFRSPLSYLMYYVAPSSSIRHSFPRLFCSAPFLCRLLVHWPLVGKDACARAFKA